MKKKRGSSSSSSVAVVVLAIILSRGEEVKDWDLFLEGIVQIVEKTSALPVTVISEGHSMVKRWTKDNNIRHNIMKPKFATGGIRKPQSDKIVKHSTHMLVISKGDKHVREFIKKMNKANKVCVEIKA